MTSCPLSSKSWLLALIAIAVIGSLTAWAYIGAENAVGTTARSGLESTAAVMASQINASEIATLQPGDETTPQYREIVEKLRTMRSMDDNILNAYILKVNPDQSATFLVDDLTFSDPAGSASIGDVSTDPNREAIFTALSVPSSSKKPYTTKYGSFMTGYAPIDDSATDSTGNTAAVLCIDISAQTYEREVNASGFAILLSGIVSILLVVGSIILCCRASGGKDDRK